MKFEQNPTDDHKHSLIFETELDEVEAIAAAYRERLLILAKNDKIDQIDQFERDVSEWSDSSDRTIYTNNPLTIALTLESFHTSTNTAVKEIAARPGEPAFDSDAIARRMRLGDMAFLLAGKIKVEFDNDKLYQMLDDSGASLFESPAASPRALEQ